MSRWLALVVASAVLLLSPFAHGAEVKVEGILKAIDAKERTLTVEKRTAKGTKEVSLEVAEEAGDLASLKVGDEVSLAYDSTLEVVTKIGGAMTEADKVAEVLTERLADKWRAIQAKQGDALKEICDEQWERLGRDGQRTAREHYIAGLLRLGAVNDLRVSDHVAKLITSDACVISYRIQRIVVFKNGKTQELDNIESAVWVNRDRVWREVFVQETPAPDKK